MGFALGGGSSLVFIIPWVDARRYWLRRFCNSQAIPMALPLRANSMLGISPSFSKKKMRKTAFFVF
jgi:hypothetical protein